MSGTDHDSTRETSENGYDAEVTPEADTWLALDEALRLSAIERYHESRKPHAVSPNGKLHAAAHCMVENQVADNDPPEAGEAVDRLINEGLPRHEAIHAVGRIITAQLLTALKGHTPFDAKGYASALQQLNRAACEAVRQQVPRHRQSGGNKKKRDRKRRGK